MTNPRAKREIKKKKKFPESIFGLAHFGSEWYLVNDGQIQTNFSYWGCCRRYYFSNTANLGSKAHDSM